MMSNERALTHPQDNWLTYHLRFFDLMSIPTTSRTKGKVGLTVISRYSMSMNLHLCA